MRTYLTCLLSVVVGFGLLSGCEQESEIETIGLSLRPAEDVTVDGSEQPNQIAQPNGPSLIVEPEEKVHWVEVVQCTADYGPCVPQALGPYRTFDAGIVVWEAAMGDHFSDRFDDFMRGPAEIEGPIVYGELPEHARWQSDAAPLEEGGIYAFSVYRTQACDTDDVNCLSIVAAGGLFFTVEDGLIKEVPPAVVEELE